MRHPQDLLIKVVDDFLYLTTDAERARQFYDKIHEERADYNVRINASKTKTNVRLQQHTFTHVPQSPLAAPRWASFCGFQFHTKTLQLRGDYARYAGTDIIDCLTAILPITDFY